MAFLTSPF
uniref:Uncharacterized protein n=1 Tax=Arundo donax TaxID=35708 RepID=A0A0A9CAP1_ARUDO